MIYTQLVKGHFHHGQGRRRQDIGSCHDCCGTGQEGVKVHLTSTDPADHLSYVFAGAENISVSHIDEKQELRDYQNEVLAKARETMSEDDVAYIEEDLRSPCTQEIAVFRAFAEIVDKSENELVIIDTAPTGIPYCS